jgi:hypothetical protein
MYSKRSLFNGLFYFLEINFDLLRKKYHSYADK